MTEKAERELSGGDGEGLGKGARREAEVGGASELQFLFYLRSVVCVLATATLGRRGLEPEATPLVTVVLVTAVLALVAAAVWGRLGCMTRHGRCLEPRAQRRWPSARGEVARKLSLCHTDNAGYGDNAANGGCLPVSAALAVHRHGRASVGARARVGSSGSGADTTDTPAPSHLPSPLRKVFPSLPTRPVPSPADWRLLSF